MFGSFWLSFLVQGRMVGCADVLLYCRGFACCLPRVFFVLSSFGKPCRSFEKYVLEKIGRFEMSWKIPKLESVGKVSKSVDDSVPYRGGIEALGSLF